MPENLAITNNKEPKAMENKEKQITDEQKDPKAQAQNIEPAGENLSEAELEKVAGGKSYFESRSNSANC
jgi:hypothetical protein